MGAILKTTFFARKIFTLEPCIGSTASAAANVPPSVAFTACMYAQHASDNVSFGESWQSSEDTIIYLLTHSLIRCRIHFLMIRSFVRFILLSSPFFKVYFDNYVVLQILQSFGRIYRHLQHHQCLRRRRMAATTSSSLAKN